MDRIWAPWRMEYVGGEKDPRESACFLCIDEKMDVSSLVLLRRPLAFVVMNRYPYSNGHVMIVPNRHVGRVEDLTDEELLDMMGLVRTLSSTLKEELNAEGLNLGINMGKAAGAGLEEHIHIHMVPRWFGDTNFMPVFGETKVISEHLYATYQRLKKKLDERSGA
jgi:ATP adenylyltransferase